MHKYFANILISLPRSVKQSVMISLDAAFSIFAFWAALSLRLERFVNPSETQILIFAATTAALIIVLACCRQYNAIYRYLGLKSLLSLIVILFSFSLVFALVVSVRLLPETPKSIAVLYPIFLVFFLVFIRLSARFILAQTGHLRPGNEIRRAFIYGAGSAGRQLTMALSVTNEMKIVGYIDDNPNTWGSFLNGVRVFSPDDAKAAFERLEVSDLLLAIPSLSRERRRAIVEAFSSHKLRMRTLPGVTALATGNIKADDLTDLRVEDLLGRDPSSPDPKLISHCTHAKTVLITGAGGSIGSEICRQVLATNPTTLLLADQNEFGLYDLDQQLKLLQQNGVGTEANIVPLIANVKNEHRLKTIFDRWAIDTIYHAAAYKHVPLVELNVATSLENNVFGTLNLVNLAQQYNVQNLVLISTDKAVRPTNFMGASKRVAEMILQAKAKQAQHQTLLSMVRFGNVLNSSGSVVPLFKKQIQAGGPITLTHPDVTRFFMTIPEASQLVIQAGSMALGGDVFVLDMGEPVRIYDLASKMIELSGKTLKDSHSPNGDVEIQISGLRPGEKKYEELLIGDNPVGTDHPRIWKAYEDFLSWEDLEPHLSKMKKSIVNNDATEIQNILKHLVSGYIPSSPIADLYK